MHFINAFRNKSQVMCRKIEKISTHFHASFVVQCGADSTLYCPIWKMTISINLLLTSWSILLKNEN